MLSVAGAVAEATLGPSALPLPEVRCATRSAELRAIGGLSRAARQIRARRSRIAVKYKSRHGPYFAQASVCPGQGVAVAVTAMTGEGLSGTSSTQQPVFGGPGARGVGRDEGGGGAQAWVGGGRGDGAVASPGVGRLSVPFFSFVISFVSPSSAEWGEGDQGVPAMTAGHREASWGIAGRGWVESVKKTAAAAVTLRVFAYSGVSITDYTHSHSYWLDGGCRPGGRERPGRGGRGRAVVRRVARGRPRLLGRRAFRGLGNADGQTIRMDNLTVLTLFLCFSSLSLFLCSGGATARGLGDWVAPV